MDKKAVLAIVLSVIIWVGWQKFYLEPYQKAAKEHAAAEKALREASVVKTVTETGAQPVSSARKSEMKQAPEGQSMVPLEPAQKNFKEQVATVETSLYQAGISNSAYLLRDWQLKKFEKTLDKKDGIIDLQTITGFSKQMRLRFADSTYASVSNLGYTRRTSNKVELDQLDTENIFIERQVDDTGKNYNLRVTYNITFKKDPPEYVYFDFVGNPKRENDDEGSIFGQQPDKVQLSFRGKEGRESFFADAITETKKFSTGVYWFGVNTRYFVLAALPNKEVRPHLGMHIEPVYIEGKKYAVASIQYPTKGQRQVSIPFDIYFGPKNLKDLEAVGPGLADALDFGWTSVIAIPILKSLKFLYSYIGNYGVAIILLTLFIKILLFPLTYKGMKSMAKMSKLNPVMQNLREKYKDDRERLNKEMMNLMKTQGYNPLGGCLPILVQMPIFFALYRVLFNSMELFHAPFGFWIKDLSAPDPLFITPIIVVFLFWLQQKLTPTTNMDPAQQKVMQFMPVMFGVFMIMLPSGLNIYMAVNSGVSILQQYYLNKRFGVHQNVTKSNATPAAKTKKA